MQSAWKSACHIRKVISKDFFLCWCCNCGIQRTQYDTNDRPRIKIVIYSCISHCLTWLWVCFCFFLVALCCLFLGWGWFNQLQLLALPFLLLSFYENVQSCHWDTKWNAAFEFQRPDTTFDSISHGKVLFLQKVQSELIRPASGMLDGASSANDANGRD